MTAAPEAASVFLLADNRLLREALTKLLEKQSDLRIVGAGAFSSAAVEQIALAAPNVLVLDSFEEGSHLEFLREAHRRLHSLKVVVIGMDSSESSFLRAVREGALGYVLKDASALEVVSTVRAVASGEAVCPPQLSVALFRCAARQHQVPSFHVKLTLGLTSRQQQLVPLIGRGLTNKEIASQLQLAEQTVRNHVHRMLRKVGASDRLAVVELCRMQGLPV
ncbi:MAG TPA: response regulator transcription factor [Terriglobales bacterium]|nr:response regulator transcription factor [Terriglobales bacterium]